MKRYSCTLLTLVTFFTIGCPKEKQPENPHPKSLPTTQQSQTSSSPSKKIEKKLGESCTTEQPFGQGDCVRNLICGPGPGGFCTALKTTGSACDAPGIWVDTARAGEICAPPCKTDNDCRSSEGYYCDPGWNACSVPGLPSPKPPVCAAATLKKKSFGPARQLSTAKSPGEYTFEPTAALLSDGAIAAAYITKGPMFGGNVLGLGLISAKGEAKGDMIFTASEREDHFDPWMAADRKGKLYLVWLGFNGHRYPERDVQIGFSTMIAIGPQKKNPKADAIYVAYSSEEKGGMRVVHSLDGGVSFSKAVTVLDGAYGDLEVDETGTVHIVAVTAAPRQGESKPAPTARFGDQSNVVTYALSEDQGSSFLTYQVSSPEQKIPMYFSNPQVVSDTKKKLLYVVYPAGTPDGKWDIFLATSKDEGKTWSNIKVNDDASCANHMTPTAVLDPKTNKVHVIWTENRSGTGGVAYSVCDSGGKKCSANEAINDTPFAAYSLGRFTTKWQGEYYTLLLDPKSRKLHAIWTQSVLEGDQARSRIFHAEAKL